MVSLSKKACSKYHRTGEGLFSGSRLICTVSELFDVYVVGGTDQREIAKDLNITIYGLRWLLKCAKIPKRTSTEVGLKQAEKYKKEQNINNIYVDKDKFLCTKQEFLDLYVKEGLGISQLAKKLNVSQSIVWRIFKRYKIPTRNVSEGKLLAKERRKKTQNSEYLYKNCNIICSKEDFRRLYYDEFKNLDEIAAILHIVRETLSRKVHESGFVLRTFKENGRVAAKKFPKLCGENNAQWKGGMIKLCSQN